MLPPRLHPLPRCFALLALALSGFSHAARAASSSDFSYQASPTYENGTLPYRLYTAQGFALPANATKKYPLIIWFHGLGERGTNNTAQLANGVINLANNTNQTYDPAFVMAPQVGTDTGGWTSSYSPAIHIAETRLFLAIEDLKTRFRIDPDRIYVMGLSMGGGGTWNIGTRYPGYFAAIAPMSMSGSGAKEAVALMSYLPIWAFAAQDDTSYHNSTQSTVTNVRDVGGQAIFNSYLTGGHSGTTWGAAANDPDFYKWLMAQRRLGTPPANGPWLRVGVPSSTGGFNTAASSATFSGTGLLATATMSSFSALNWKRTSGGTTTAPVSLTPGSNWAAGALGIQSGVNVFHFLTTTLLNSTTTRAGNSTYNDSIVVNDTTVPTLTLINPTNTSPYLSPTDSLTIKGSASDDLYVTRVAWSNDRGGSGVAGADFENEIAGQVNWFASKIPLQPGKNILTFTANDKAGNTATRTLEVFRSPARGGDFFRQNFNTSSNVLDYESSSKNLGTGIFNDVAAAANGGVWSINGGTLQIVRPGGASELVAGFTRGIDLDGPPSGVALVSFEIALPSSPNVFTTFGTLGLGMYMGSNNAVTFGSGYSARNTELQIVGAGTNLFKFKINTTASSSFASNGTVHSAKWFINSSSVVQTYLAPNGTTQTVNADCSDLWVGNQQVLDNIAKNPNYKSKNLGFFNFTMSSPDALTMRLDNMAFSDCTVPTALHAWKVTNFAGDALNAAIAGDTADPEGDGLTNLMEYALSGDPNIPSRAMLPRVEISGEHAKLTFNRLATNDITYIVESSTDLVAWMPIATLHPSSTAWIGSAIVAESGTGATREVVVEGVETLSSGSKNFLRLRVSNP